MKPELEYIKKVVENVTGEKLSTKSRQKSKVFARFIYFRLAKDKTMYSYETIGKAVNRDHATMVYALKCFDRDILGDIVWKEKYYGCKGIIDNGLDPEDPNNQHSSKLLSDYIHAMINLRIENEFLKQQLEVIPDTPKGKLMYYFRNLPLADQGNALFKIETMYKIRENDKDRYRTA